MNGEGVRDGSPFGPRPAVVVFAALLAGLLVASRICRDPWIHAQYLGMGMFVEVDPEGFETMGIAPVRGRAFSGLDGADAAPVIMVNETLARQLSPDQEIVVRRIRSWRDEDLRYRRWPPCPCMGWRLRVRRTRHR